MLGNLLNIEIQSGDDILPFGRLLPFELAFGTLAVDNHAPHPVFPSKDSVIHRFDSALADDVARFISADP